LGFTSNKALAPFFPTTDWDGKKKKKSNFPPTNWDGKKQKEKKLISLLAAGREGKPKKKKKKHNFLPLTRREIMFCKALTS